MTHGRLVGQLYVMTGDHAEAHDAVQEAFIRAWAHREKLNTEGAPEAWVRAAAWRIAMSRWNRARLGSLLMRSQPQPQPQAAVAVAGAIVAGVLYNSSAGIRPEHQRPAGPVAPPAGPSTKPAIRSPAPTLASSSPGSSQPVPSPSPSARISVPIPPAGP